MVIPTNRPLRRASFISDLVQVPGCGFASNGFEPSAIWKLNLSPAWFWNRFWVLSSQIVFRLLNPPTLSLATNPNRTTNAPVYLLSSKISGSAEFNMALESLCQCLMSGSCSLLSAIDALLFFKSQNPISNQVSSMSPVQHGYCPKRSYAEIDCPLSEKNGFNSKCPAKLTWTWPKAKLVKKDEKATLLTPLTFPRDK